MIKNTANFLDVLQNMPTFDALSNISSIVSRIPEGFDTISSIASIVGNLSMPISEPGSLSNQMGKLGPSFGLMQNIAMPVGMLVKAATIPYPVDIAKFAQSINDASQPLSSTQRFLSTPPDFRWPLHTNTSSSSQISEDKLSDQLKVKKLQLECIINNCYFEPGISTEADEYFSELWNDLGKSSLEILSEIVNENLDDEHILEGVLHILSSLPYTEMIPMGITIGIACGFNHSPLVIDRLIACFEDWEDPAAIRILESMDLAKTPWLSNYRDRVISTLKQKI